MSDNWKGPYLWAFSPSNYSTKKSVTDNGRTVDEIYCLNSTGKFEAGGFGSGSATVPLSQRDNYPFVERGDAVLTFSRQPDHTRSGIAIIAIFIVETVVLGVAEDGKGTVTYSGVGVSKELQRKILRIPYISNIYEGTTTAWTDTYIFLDVAHQAAEGFYNGGIIEIGANMCEISSYASAENRAYVQNWLPIDPSTGGTADYTIYHGKSSTNITKAIAATQTGWSTDTTGTPGGSWNAVNGRKSLDLINEIAEESGYMWATNITDTPLRWLFWFNTVGTPTASGVKFYKVTAANKATMYSDVNLGPVINATRTSDTRSGVTRLIVTSGDNVSLVGATIGDLTVPSGFSLNLSESMIISTDEEVGLSVYEIVEQAEQFKNIQKGSDTSEATLIVQQRLVDAGVNFLRQRAISGYTYIVKTAIRRDANIGQSAYFEYEKIVAGETIWTEATNLWIRSITNTANSDDGLRYSVYELGTNYHPPLTDGSQAAAERMKKLGGTGSSAGSVIIIGGGTSVPAPGVTDHGALTGRGDSEDHTWALLVDGTRALTGNLAVNAEVTIDGVDLSEHVIDADAHHNHATASDGISVATGQVVSVRLALDSGLDFEGGPLVLGTPSEITAITTNWVVGSSHSHSVEATYNALTTPSQLLKSNADGRIAVSGFGVNIVPSADRLEVASELLFIGAQDILTSADGLRLYPAANLSLVPKSSILSIGDSSYNALTKSSHFSSGLRGVGWGISYDGHLDARSAYLEELYVTVFTMEQARVKTGEMIVTPSGSYLALDATLTGVGNTVTITVEDAQGLPGIPIFANADQVMLQPIDTSGTSLIIANVWGTVTNYTKLANNLQRWSFYINSMGVAPNGIVAKTGSVAIDYGQSGDGWVRINAIDQMGSPYIALGRWTGNPYTADNIENPIRLGDLGGATGDHGLMGLFIGRVDGRHIKMSENHLEAHGMAMSMYSDVTGSTGYIRVNAVEVTVDYGSGTQTLRPNADVAVGYDRAGKPWTDNLVYSGGATGYVLIDDDPDSANTGNWIANTPGEDAVATFDLQNISAYTNTEQITIKAHVTVYPSTTDMRLVAEIVDNTGLLYNSHTSPVTIATHESSTGLKTFYVKPLEIMSDGMWDGARLRLHWYSAPVGVSSEVIRLDPNVPSIAAGDPIPTAHDAGGEGFIVYDDSGTFKLRIGGTTATGGGAMVWDGTEMYFRDGNGDKVITLDSGSGASYFSGSMSIGDGGRIRAGLTTLDIKGIAMSPASSIPIDGGPGPDDGTAIAFGTHAAPIGLVSAYTDINGQGLILQGMTTNTSKKSYFILEALTSETVASRSAKIFGLAGAEVVASSSYIDFELDGDSKLRFELDSAVFTQDVTCRSGLYVGASSAQSADYGQLILNQAGGDGVILDVRSTDVIGMTTQGMNSTNTYFEVRKENTSAGGAVVKGAGESTRGLVLVGSANTTNSATGVASVGPVMLRAQINNAAQTTGTAIVLQVGSTARWMLKWDGHVYMDSVDSESYFDEYDDVSLVRAMSKSSNLGFIRSKWDKFVSHNQQDLIDLDIVTDTGFINQQNITKLYAGAIWQLHERIAELEAKLGYLH